MRLRQLARSKLHAQIELLTTQGQQFFIEFVCRLLSQLLWLHDGWPLHYLAFNKHGLDWQFCGSKTKRFARNITRYAFHLIDHGSGLNLGNPVFDIALTLAHTNFDRLGGNRLVRKYANPDLATTTNMPVHRTTCSLDLPGGQPSTLHGFQAEFAKADSVATLRQPPVTAFLYLAKFDSFWLQHDGLPRYSAVVSTFFHARFTIENLALEYPHLDAEDSEIGRTSCRHTRQTS